MRAEGSSNWSDFLCATTGIDGVTGCRYISSLGEISFRTIVAHSVSLDTPRARLAGDHQSLGRREPLAGDWAVAGAGTVPVPDRRSARAGPVDRVEAHVDPAPGAAGRVAQGGTLGLFPARGRRCPAEASQALELVLASLQRDKQAKADQRQLKAVLKMEPEELCRRQANCKC